MNDGHGDLIGRHAAPHSHSFATGPTRLHVHAYGDLRHRHAVDGPRAGFTTFVKPGGGDERRIPTLELGVLDSWALP